MFTYKDCSTETMQHTKQTAMTPIQLPPAERKCRNPRAPCKSNQRGLTPKTCRFAFI